MVWFLHVGMVMRIIRFSSDFLQNLQIVLHHHAWMYAKAAAYMIVHGRKKKYCVPCTGEDSSRVRRHANPIYHRERGRERKRACACACARQRETETERDRERQGERQRERQRGRQTTETETETGRHTHIHTRKAH